MSTDKSSRKARMAVVRRYLQDATPERMERFGERNYELAEWSAKRGHWLVDFFRQRLAPQPQPLHEILLREGLLNWAAESPRALVFASASGRVLFHNEAAATTLAGSSLSIKKDYLVGHTDAVTDELRGFLQIHAPPGRRRGHVFHAGPGVAGLRASCQALYFHDPQASAQALLLLEFHGDAPPAVDEMLLQTWFGLSAAEAALGAAFAAGESLQAFAERRSVSITTVRTQFARIKAKTGAEDQANVVRLLLQASQS